MSHPFTTRNYIKNIIWLVVVASLLGLSTCKLLETLHVKPSPGPFLIITTFVLFVLFIKVIVRVILIRRGLPKG